jgi:hypothetical protein
LEGNVFSLQKQQTNLFLEILAIPHTTATFDPQDEKKYTPLRVPAGTILAVLEKVEPYLDGYTISIRFGNPTTATYSGIKGKVQWGRKLDFKKDEAYNKLSEKMIDLPDSIPAGRWTSVKFNVVPATAEQVRRIVLDPTFDMLSLSGS